MIAVLFEVRPTPEGLDTYLEIAAQLSEDLSRMEGFISVERYQSLTTPNKLLSLSQWTDEEAVARWRQHGPHRVAQDRGKRELFAGYTIYVMQILRSYGSDSNVAAR